VKPKYSQSVFHLMKNTLALQMAVFLNDNRRHQPDSGWILRTNCGLRGGGSLALS
jgi:hypothetical protein